jgi:hypothetical protein
VNKDNLEQVIAALKSEKQIHMPFAGLYELVDGSDEYGYKIKANKEGLVELAIALLEAARQDYRHDGPKIIPLDIDDKINSGTDGLLPQEIELSAIIPPEENRERKKGNWLQRNLPVTGCLFLFVFILVSLAVGIITVFGWIF